MRQLTAAQIQTWEDTKDKLVSCKRQTLKVDILKQVPLNMSQQFDASATLGYNSKSIESNIRNNCPILFSSGQKLLGILFPSNTISK